MLFLFVGRETTTNLMAKPNGSVEAQHLLDCPCHVAGGTQLLVRFLNP
jgi:hypothetical protein